MVANNKFRVISISLIVLLFINLALGLNFGSVSISLGEMLQIFQGVETENWRIFLQIRLPRVIGAVLVGIFLALSGVILQATLSNPIADSGILGISSVLLWLQL